MTRNIHFHVIAGLEFVWNTDGFLLFPTILGYDHQMLGLAVAPHGITCGATIRILSWSIMKKKTEFQEHHLSSSREIQVGIFEP
jgi:hypothetical protein